MTMHCIDKHMEIVQNCFFLEGGGGIWVGVLLFFLKSFDNAVLCKF